MVVERIKLVEASTIGEVFFYNHNYDNVRVGSVHNGFDFYLRTELDKNPVLTGKDLVIYTENGRLKGSFKLICHDRERLPFHFNVACNRLKMSFDERHVKADEAGTFEFENIDLVDVENPDVLENGDLVINIRFVMAGFQVPEKFICISDEMKNWFKTMGVMIWLHQKPVLVKQI